jgi:hypothetical protein
VFRSFSGLNFWLVGFVAIVNKELSAKYETLVNSAPDLIKELPWGKEFEVDVFKKPDFTALEIVSFCTGGDWAMTYTVTVNLPLDRHSCWNQREPHGKHLEAN